MPSQSWFIAGSALLLSLAVGAKGPHPCTETDYYYEYTECDSTGSRWRVAIPQSHGSCIGLPEPVRGTECTFSCEAGEFLEMSSQECTQCAAGTYSLGSGIRFDDWETIPTGFSSLATYLDNGPHGNDSLTCNSSSWFPQSSYLESNRDECTVSLIYAVHLKKQGSVSFDYQYTDHKLFFDFFIQNDQCQEMDQTADKKWLKLTSHGEWATHTVNLKSGTNILYWKTAGVLGAKVMKPVLLKNVHIEGVAYASECFPCKPGTFSQTPGSSSCHPCPRDTHSGHGASSCTPCNTTTHYAPTGSGVCKARPPCSKKDYFQIHTPCDLEGKTQVIYRWVEPQICLVGVAGAETLPPSGDRETCPPCNPGFYNNNTATCSPCAPGTFSDGVKACESCPAGTEPAVGYQFKWWNIVPANMKTSCFNVGNSKCDGMNGWEVAGDHIRSGAGGSDNDYLILNLHVPGFKPPMSVTGGAGTEFGRIIFEFEMVCSSDCELYFMMVRTAEDKEKPTLTANYTVAYTQDINRKSTTVVESWEGSKVKQSYTYIMTKNASVSYTWAFQRTNQASEVRQNVNDMVRIYSISVSNAVDGASSECQACALLSQPSGSLCVPCPPGHYIHTHTSQCTECPPNTHLTSHSTQSPEACKKCGPSSKSNKEHSRCYSDCVFSYSENKVSLSFDYSSLGSVGTLMNGPHFTSKGTKYYHLFNISICGGEDMRAVCTDNVTDLSSADSQRETGESANAVESFICQSTIIPSSGRGFRTALSSQSISLADTFLGATVALTLGGVKARPDLFPQTTNKVRDVNFFYRSLEATSSCEAGRNVVVTLRCNSERSTQGELTVPSQCPAGTCDGCIFHFLWESSGACPQCTPTDYHQIEAACKGGLQDKLYVWNEPKLCVGGVSLPENKTWPCNSMDFLVKMGAAIGAFTAALLFSITCYFWKKNKRLEYKYSKLVMSSNKESELPGADSCAVMEGEVEDEVVYSKKTSLIRKLKAITSRGNRERYENVQLNSSQSNGLVWG
ncbi:endosome/lysosome-associated apoptosis and autophagy regulator family member 2-like isoform X1 [Coregonus clupeaformis]|uniref:endosome/lysosome-associated apoptosis and autophagy regulator family member 2-like isoform X1 n=1 Tax=Coregonus clupeaformis TaxID=59861 RepID=UPI001E1C82E1|nr:endosome/lysosome-associated apoptosis and autophagy regulator family member 2-like isoform X1 [Coregonus clupeaformis]